MGKDMDYETEEGYLRHRLAILVVLRVLMAAFAGLILWTVWRVPDPEGQLHWQVLGLLSLLALTIGVALWLRRDYREQLREQLRFNMLLIDALPLPLSLRDEDGRFVRVNKAFEQKYGLAAEQVIGRPAASMLPPEYRGEVTRMERDALATGAAVEHEFAVGAEYGARNTLVRMQALRRPDQSVLGIVAVQTDLTAVRRGEAELKERNALLKQLSVQMIDAQEEERRRIARDLHDQVGQILTALKLQLGSLARRPRIDKPAEALVTPIDLAEEALRHTRDLSASLHPHMLDDLGLEQAVNWLVQRFIRPSIADVDLRFRLVPARGPQEIELVAYRVVQEALTNVVRHARATRAGVILEAQAGQLVIEVIDDGVGFEAGETWFEQQRGESLGVSAMRDRVSEVGGDLHLDSSPGVGTSLRVKLPWVD
jgi:two-component system, NarL family, sensor histidine kinase UhpB